MADNPADGPATEPEIEVTPEIIEAGVEKLYEFDLHEPFRDELRKGVVAVFLEMLRHRHLSPRTEPLP